MGTRPAGPRRSRTRRRPADDRRQRDAPGLRRHLHGLVLEPVGRISGHGVELPQLGAGLAIVAVAGFLQLNFRAGTSNIYPGGAIGAFVVDKLNYYHFGYAGSNVIICSLILVGLLLATEYMFLYLYVVVRHVSVFAYRTFVMVREARARAALESPAVQLPKSRRVGRIPRRDVVHRRLVGEQPLGMARLSASDASGHQHAHPGTLPVARLSVCSNRTPSRLFGTANASATLRAGSWASGTAH